MVSFMNTAWHSPRPEELELVFHNLENDLPLWNFSSIGGTIWRTFTKSSFVADDISGVDELGLMAGWLMVSCSALAACSAKSVLLGWIAKKEFSTAERDV